MYIKFCKFYSILKMWFLNQRKNVKIKRITKCSISKNAKITANGKINIGSISLEDNVLVSAATKQSRITIGDNVFINRNTILACRKEISIGDDVIIGPDVLIYDHDHNYGLNGRVKGNESDRITPTYKVGSIIIQDNVWIAGGVIILRDSFIGKNSIIGAGVVLKGNIPENSIVVDKRSFSVSSLAEKLTQSIYKRDEN